MPDIIIFSQKQSARLQYVLDWVFKDIFRLNYLLTGDTEKIKNEHFFISYGTFFPNALYIPASGLLWEKCIQKQQIKTGLWKGIPAFFYRDKKNVTGVQGQFHSIPVTGSDEHLPFDFFSAIFYLITRYEEYLDYAPDKHQRFPHSESILYKNNCLKRPVADEWIYEFYLLLKKRITIDLPAFGYQPTYDIDIAFSFKHKGFQRTTGALVKSFLKGNFKEIAERISILTGRKKDPFDCFDELFRIHKAYNLTPFYFVLASLKTTSFDRNNHPALASMKKLIKDFNAQGNTGMHPSYFSFEKEVFRNEKAFLEKTAGKKIRDSRQHYIRLRLPETYYHLSEEGMCNDWSMGYGAHLGFRAGTGRSFFWFDLKNEQVHSIKVHPFCFMDTTAHFEEKLNAEAAFEQLESMKTLLQKTGSSLVTVFHNFSLGTDPQWQGWKELYFDFLKRI